MLVERAYIKDRPKVDPNYAARGARDSGEDVDELLTQSEILEKETLPPAKEADQHAEAEPDEAHHGQDL